MLRARVPWWMYGVAALYALTLLFNARQEAWGPANMGWTAAWPTFKVVDVVPGGPMDDAGLRAGDVIEAVNGLSLTGVPDWFVARAHFERDRPINLQIKRGVRHLHLQAVITAPAFRAWSRSQRMGVFGLYVARFMLLSLAILVAFSRPQQLSARLAGMMLAVGAVAEGYPISGWAAALRHLPAAFAVPICLASVSCLFASMVWLSFSASFPRPQLSRTWRYVVVAVPIALWGIPVFTSSIAIIYVPSAMARPWPLMLSGPVRGIQDMAGVSPLLFLGGWPFHRPIVHARLLELWFAVSVLYFAAGFVMLVASYFRTDRLHEKRRVGALCLASLLFGFITLHNFFVRNWTAWFSSATPELFSAGTFAAEGVFLSLVPLAVAWCVLTQYPRGTTSRHEALERF